MRIVIAFVGNAEAAKKDLVKLVKRLKKEKINVDIINLGAQEVSAERLWAFLRALNGSHGTGAQLFTMPWGPSFAVAEAIIASQLLARKGRALPTSTRDFPFGVDLSGLALTLRVSMEEQRQRHKAKAQWAERTPAAHATLQSQRTDNSEDALLKRTISQQESGQAQLQCPGRTAKDEQVSSDPRISLEDAELDQVKTAAKTAKGTPQPAMGEEDYDVMQDATFLQTVLEKLPGVDPPS